MEQAVVTQDDFDEFFRREFVAISAIAYGVLGDRDGALDVAQEAFARLHRHWGKVSHYDHPFSWVRKVAIRIAVKNRFHKFREASSEEIDAPAKSEDVTVVIDVRRAVLQLPKMQRAATVLFYFDDLSIDEIAQALSCREGTAKAHLFKARQHLALLLKDYKER